MAINKLSAVNGAAGLTTFKYTATASQTTFSGADLNGVTFAYTVGKIIVFINGVALNPTDDYTASTGTSVDLIIAASIGDSVVIVSFDAFNVANTYSTSQIDASLALKSNLASPAFTGTVTGGGFDLVATQTFSAASTVSVNNCFSVKYDNYKIVIAGAAAAGDPALNIRLRVSGADDSTANYGYQYNYAGGSTVGAMRGSTQTLYQAGYWGSGWNVASFEVIYPNTTIRTCFLGSVYNANGTTSFDAGLAAGEYMVNKSFDGFSFFPASSTITGTVRVYGYKN